MSEYRTICIQGNIGSGKSTLVRLLDEQNTDKYVCMQEPVNVWTEYQMTVRIYWKSFMKIVRHMLFHFK